MTDEANPVTKPIEEVARALCNGRSPQPKHSLDAWGILNSWADNREYVARREATAERDKWLRHARDVLNHMSARGMLDADTILALRNEEKEMGK